MEGCVGCDGCHERAVENAPEVGSPAVKVSGNGLDLSYSALRCAPAEDRQRRTMGELGTSFTMIRLNKRVNEGLMAVRQLLPKGLRTYLRNRAARVLWLHHQSSER